MITNVARKRLDRAGIALLYAKALHFGAHINMVCFDKTGTLTDSVVNPFSQQQLCLCLDLDSTAIHFLISIVARLVRGLPRFYIAACCQNLLVPARICTGRDCVIEGDLDMLSMQVIVMQGTIAPVHLKGSTIGCCVRTPQQLIHTDGRFRVQIQTVGSRANNACTHVRLSGAYSLRQRRLEILAGYVRIAKTITCNRQVDALDLEQELSRP